MSLTIDLPRPVEARINEEARKAGVTPAELVAEVVTRNFAGVDAEEQKRLNAPSIALLQSWLEEARKPRTPEELEGAEEDMNRLMQNLNAPRREAGERLHFPDAEMKP
jgi:hypothetical protein